MTNNFYPYYSYSTVETVLEIFFSKDNNAKESFINLLNMYEKDKCTKTITKEIIKLIPGHSSNHTFNNDISYKNRMCNNINYYSKNYLALFEDVQKEIKKLRTFI